MGLHIASPLWSSGTPQARDSNNLVKSSSRSNLFNPKDYHVFILNHILSKTHNEKTQAGEECRTIFNGKQYILQTGWLKKVFYHIPTYHSSRCESLFPENILNAALSITYIHISRPSVEYTFGFFTHTHTRACAAHMHVKYSSGELLPVYRSAEFRGLLPRTGRPYEWKEGEQKQKTIQQQNNNLLTWRRRTVQFGFVTKQIIDCKENNMLYKVIK